jgi:hypothetical protein
MSKYATIRGRIEFKDKKSYLKALSILTDGGWVDGDRWVNEMSQGEGEPPKSRSGELGEDYYDWLDEVIEAYVGSGGN